MRGAAAAANARTSAETRPREVYRGGLSPLSVSPLAVESVLVLDIQNPIKNIRNL